MKITLPTLGAVTLSLLAGAAYAASSEDRTSMPNACSDRDSNCVIQDGAPRRRGGNDASNTTPPAGSNANNASKDNKSGDKNGNRDSSR